MNALQRALTARMEQMAEPTPDPTPQPTQTAAERVAGMLGLSLEQLKEAASAEPEEREARFTRVEDTQELRRILALPRRPMSSGHDEARQLTDCLRTPHGTQTLRPLQGLGLWELATLRGLFAPLAVGSGKTLLSYLAPTVLEAKRPLLLVPAKLKRKTRDEFKHLAQHWMGPHPEVYRIESYELLGRPQAGNQLDSQGRIKKPGHLERWRPDVIIMDECHMVRSGRAAVTKRLKRYMKDNPGVTVVAMSGTITRKSLKDYAHILGWCLPTHAPVPQVWGDLEAWAGALDQKIIGKRTQAGALRLLLPSGVNPPPDTEEELTAVRSAFRDRFLETPGVIATQESTLGTSLCITTWDPKSQDPEIETLFQTLRTVGELPDGQPIADQKDLARHAKSLALGFFYRWAPKPPEEWMHARREWAQWCREVVKHNRKGLDSEGQVSQAVRQGVFNDEGRLARWIAERDKERLATGHREPPTEAVWVSDEGIQACAAWAEKHPGIIWVEHVQFGNKLSEVTGLPYYRLNGLDAKGAYIEHHKHGTPMIASMGNATGRNLQFGWSQNLITCAPASAIIWEQLLGRTHRPGQEADEVTAHLYLSCVENLNAFVGAQSEARYRQETGGAADKITFCDLDMPGLEDVEAKGGFRWNR